MGLRQASLSIPDGLAEHLDRVELAERQPRLLRTAVLRAQLLRLALRGLTAKQSSEILRCSYFSARQHYHDPAFRAQVLARVEGAMANADERFDAGARTLHQRLADTSEKAFEILQEMLVNAEDAGVTPGLRAKIALEFMDRNPDLAPTHKSEHNHKHTFSAEDLALASRTATEMNAGVIPINQPKEKAS
jgi:hypothetical protein